MTATTATEVNRAARRAANSPWTDRLARLGFCARGVVYGIVGVLALQIAWGTDTRGEDASKEGALREIAERPMGGVLLAALAVGMAGYALWRTTEAAWGKRDEEDEAKRSAKRLGSAAKAAFYGVLTVSTVRFMTSGPQAQSAGGDQKEETLTAEVLGWPAGQLLVGGVGIAIIGGSLYVAYRGLSLKFDERLDTSEMGPVSGWVVDVLGTVGMAAKGLVFGLAGFLLLKAAIDFDPDQATGLDGTLRTIAHQTYGQLLLTVTAVGIIAYGLYSFAEARYREL
jgi:hypothetical protein